MKKLNIIITIALTLAILQVPFGYYYFFGIIGMFTLMLFVAIGLGVTIWAVLLVENLQNQIK